jgi:nitrous oxidase accessory protein
VRLVRRAALAAWLVGCGPPPLAPAEPPSAGPAVPPPAGCRVVRVAEPLQARIDAARPREVLCLEPGRYPGPVRLGRELTLWGPPEAVIRSSGEGTTVRLEEDGAALLGLTVDGSGGRFDLLDAAVRVEADDARVEGVRIRNAVFGLLVEKSNRIVLRRNEIAGDPDAPLGLRGDGIRLWETRDSLIEENRLSHSRDVVIWYSPGNRLVGNRVEHGRYGTHFMYSHANSVLGNRYVGNVVGIFVMYSRDLEIRDNVIADSAGAAGVGLGAKESGNLRVTDNRFVHNTVGAYLDTSPLYEDHWNHFERNTFRLGEVGVVFHGSQRRNDFVRNRFLDNGVQVRVEGRGHALGVDWSENEFDDYAGYDLDGDGYGDVPYELRSLSEQLTTRYPTLAFFRGSPVLTLVEVIGRVVPIFQPRTILVDPRPRAGAPAVEPRLAG